MSVSHFIYHFSTLHHQIFWIIHFLHGCIKSFFPTAKGSFPLIKIIGCQLIFCALLHTHPCPSAKYIECWLPPHKDIPSCLAGNQCTSRKGDFQNPSRQVSSRSQTERCVAMGHYDTGVSSRHMCAYGPRSHNTMAPDLWAASTTVRRIPLFIKMWLWKELTELW